MEGWIFAGIVFGFFMGLVVGVVCTFGYISYKSYQNFLKFQEEMMKSEKSAAGPDYSGGISA